MLFLGETGSGKSYTIFGEDGERLGLIYRFVERLLGGRNNVPTIKVSVVDISSNEKVYDCLAYQQTAEGKIKGHKVHG